MYIILNEAEVNLVLEALWAYKTYEEFVPIKDVMKLEDIIKKQMIKNGVKIDNSEK